MRVHNVDTLSALLDRLVVERIKYASMEDKAREEAGQNNEESYKKTHQMVEQSKTIELIKDKLDRLFILTYKDKSYEYIAEQRTTKGTLVSMIEKLIIDNLDNRGSERYRIRTLENGKLDKEALMDALKTDLWLRLAVENRANDKNQIDKLFKEVVEDE